jgi:pimeloyl-ACP methyl ester carboxylesterase
VDNAIEHMVPVEGTELFVRESGGGPGLLFIHGMCGDADVWLDQQHRLSGAFRCVAYDRRGHTRSPFGTGVRTVEAHADDAAALIASLELAPVVIVGSSGGARIGVDMTRRFSPVLRGAVLSEPALIALSADGGKSFIEKVGPALRAATTPEAAVDAFFMQVDPQLWSRLPEERKGAYRANHAELFGDLAMPTYGGARGDRGPDKLLARGEERADFRRDRASGHRRRPRSDAHSLGGSDARHLRVGAGGSGKQ